ncbi:hypothetical protein SO802_003617, partial [Lithocarpus litseifolius]
LRGMKSCLKLSLAKRLTLHPSSTCIMPPIESLTNIGAITTLPKMDGIQNLENIARLSFDQEFIIHLKSASYDIRGEMRNRFNIVSIFDVPMKVNEYKLL